MSPARLWARFQASAYWKDIAWLVSGNSAAQAITLAAMPILSRLYRPADFATLSLFTSGFMFTTLAASLRYEYLVQLPRDDAEAWQVCTFIFRTSLLAILILTPGAWLLRSRIATWVEAPGFGPWVPLLPLAGALLSWSVAGQGWMQRQQRYRRSGLAEVLEKAVRNALPLGCRGLLGGPGGLLLGSLAGLAVKASFLFAPATHGPPRPRAEGAARRYARLSFSLVLSALLLAGAGAIPLVFISRRYGAEQLGQYAMANMVIALPSVLLAAAVGSAFYQRAAEHWARGLSFLPLWWATARRLLAMGLVGYGIAILALPRLVPALLGPPWREAGTLAAILAVSVCFSFITTPMDKSCLVVGAWWYLPACHAVRLLTMALATGAAHRWSLALIPFVRLMVALQTCTYLLDGWAQWSFAGRKPPHVQAGEGPYPIQE